MGIEIKEKLANGYFAEYAKPFASPSIHFDSGRVELVVALYKDAEARFSGAEPADYKRTFLELNAEERAALLAIVYGAIERVGVFPGSQARDPDPEKIPAGALADEETEEAAP